MIEKENEIGLLDLLVMLAKHIKLLTLGPVVIGLLALAVSYTLPQSYTSQAIFALPTPLSASNATATTTPTQAAAMMVSPLVLDAVIETLNLSAGDPIQVARTRLAGQVKAAVGKDELLRLDVTAGTPSEAQNIANAIIDSWFKSTVPGKQAREDLEKRVQYAKTSLDAVQRLLDRLTSEGQADLTKPLTRGESGISIVAVGELQSRFIGEMLSNQRSLQGLARDVVKQPPTLPSEPVAPKKRLIAILSALCSGFAFLLWVFIRQAWENAAKNQEVAKKQRVLKSLLIPWSHGD